jgi:DNA mismatch repair protein MutS2
VTPAEVVQARREIDAAARAVIEAAPAPPAPTGRPAQADELQPGREVWVTRVGGRAVVTAAPKGGKVQVQAGPLKLTVALDEVRIPDAPAPAPSARARRGHNAFDAPAAMQAPVRGGVSTLDVRGERVDAAVGLAEKFLDDALRAGQEAVCVIHGHGTGALRDTLRAHLGSFPGVAAVRPGTPAEGGDGVTVVTLA